MMLLLIMMMTRTMLRNSCSISIPRCPIGELDRSHTSCCPWPRWTGSGQRLCQMLCEGFGKHLDPGKNYEQSLLRIQQCHENHPSSHSSLGPASSACQVWRGVSALGDGLPSNIGERHAGRGMWSSELYWYGRHGNADSPFFLKKQV